MSKKNIKIIGIILLFINLPSCEKEPPIVDWHRFYNEPIIHEQQTAFGHLQLSIASPKSWNHQTWFYFHGAGGDLASWEGVTQKILQHRKNNACPKIVSISLGPKWFLIDRIYEKKYTGSTLFWNTVIPTVRKNIHEMGKTAALGHSMGGFNALSLFLDKPDFWDFIVLMTPAIADLSPYASQQEKKEYVTRTHARTWKQWLKHLFSGSYTDTGHIDIILDNWRKLSKDADEWQLINPLSRLEELQTPSPTKFFLSCGKSDPFGFMEGTLKAIKLLKEAGISVESQMVRGGHMAIPYEKVSEFLENNL